jgi:hypothetical protein
MIGIIIFIIFASAGYRKYLKDSEANNLVKGLHLLFMFLLFFGLYYGFKSLLWEMIKEGKAALYTFPNEPEYPSNLDVIGNITILTVSLYGAGLILKLTAQGKGRKLLLITSPLFIISTTLDLSKALLLDIGSLDDVQGATLMVLGIVSMGYAIIILFYLLPNNIKKLKLE